jgi:hypothetical protein
MGMKEAALRNRFIRFCAIGLAAVLLSGCAAVTMLKRGPDLRHRISGESIYRSGEPVSIRFELTNNSSRPVAVLLWNTPFEGLMGKAFDVFCNGQEMTYQGPMAKRGAPSARNYAIIEAHATITATLDLATAYALPAQGQCVVSFRGTVLDATEPDEVPRPMDKLHTTPVSGDPFTFQISPS